MKRCNGLFKHIVSFDNLLLAAHKAALGKRDKPAVARFVFHLEPELLALQTQLQNGTYRPGAYFTFEICDPKCRRICAAPFRDRVVHHAVCNWLEPHFERRLISDTYACRSGKGTHAAIRRAQQFARRYRYVYQCDIRKYFQRIDHAVLKALLRRMFKDPPLLALLDTIIEHAPPDAEPGKGVPIGNLTSQHFANLYLGELDHYLKERVRIQGYLRYMDDFLLFGDRKEALHQVLADLRVFLQGRLRLSLKEEALRLAPVTEGISFLGLRIFPGTIRLNRRTLGRFRRKWQATERAYRAGRIDMAEFSTSSAALFAHIAHVDSRALRRRLLRGTLIPG